jgi:aquaporin Z
MQNCRKRQWQRSGDALGSLCLYGASSQFYLHDREDRSGARNIGTNGAIAVGGYIALAGLWAAPITGASMNRARSFAPDLVRGNFGTTWIYVVGPAIGALIGVIFEWILKGSPTAAGAIAAQGAQGGDDSTDA